MYATSFFHHSTRSERDFHDKRRGAIYLPDRLATKLLRVCDAAVDIELSEPHSRIHSDLEDLWSNIRASSLGSVDSFRAEEDVRRFAERYGLVHCLSCSNLGWLGDVGKLNKTPPENLYEEILEAAFGIQNGGTAFENGGQNNYSHIQDLFINFDEPDGPTISSSEITHPSSPPRETQRVYYDRPHTPQIIYVNLSQQKYHDFWEVPTLMKKPRLFPPTPRNIKDWIFWRRVYGRH